MSDYENRYQKAKKRVEEIKGFYGHLAAYVGVMLLLIVINLLTSPETFWVIWPMFFWGMAVVIHGVATFGKLGPFNEDWEERKIQELMARDSAYKRKNEELE